MCHLLGVLALQLSKSSFSKVIADSGTFSHFIADFSKIREPFFCSLCSFYSKVIPDNTQVLLFSKTSAFLQVSINDLLNTNAARVASTIFFLHDVLEISCDGQFIKEAAILLPGAAQRQVVDLHV